MKLQTFVYLCLIAFVVSLRLTAHAQTFSVVHAFNGVNFAAPLSGVTLGAGVLYGTTECLNDCGGYGTVYQITPLGSNWYYAPLFLFSGRNGLGPQARVVFGPDNHLYGTTVNGGPQEEGAVFSLTPRPTICATANCFWAESVLYQFMGPPDGDGPGGGDLVWDQMGNMYGTTIIGGNSNLGTVYQMTKSGNNWNEMPIHSFTGPDGQEPFAGVILDSSGNLFGTTYGGGLYGFGTVFELTYNIDSGWTETVLYNFQNLSDGQGLDAGLVSDSAGNLYGATSHGGARGGGTVFELSPAGNSWAFTLLYSFSGGCGPGASLALDTSGNLYGTTFCGGANGYGNVFKLTNTQNGWVYSSLHDFTDGTDGAYPVSNVTIAADGTLYGTTEYGGNSSCNPPYGCGVVWMIKP
jgi:uncharacterized repeat protein (TIGR03803 family)